MMMVEALGKGSDKFRWEPIVSLYPYLFPLHFTATGDSKQVNHLFISRSFKTLVRGEREARMESGQMPKKDLKVEIPSEAEMIAGGVESHAAAAISGQGASGISRQPSVTKTNCLCSPTTHAGSFRCRLHRAPSLQRTKSIDSQSASLRDSTSKANSATAE
ncbi:hypothetical protein QQP08_008096 [Theobroma cacao]|nr:hypothetical protein QQP08_008096 [Theobroma cacao]